MPDTETITRGAYTAAIHRDGTQVFADIYLTGSTEPLQSWTGTHIKSARLWAMRNLEKLSKK